MVAKRIIPCLDVKNGQVVKGINFEGLREVGDPVEMGAKYSAEGADELVYLDISASAEGRRTFTEIVNRIARRINIPFTVGGGISTLADADRLLGAGADAFAGYAFDYMDNLDGVDVFKSRYDSSLGFLYDKFMTESEFAKLSRLEREQALLQALVVPDEEADGMDGTKMVTAADIETDVTEVPYDIISLNGITKDGDSYIVEEEDANMVLFAEPAQNCQLVVSFDNLRRVSDDGRDVGDFKVKCKKDDKQVEANNKKNNQTISGIVDYDLNMGYYEDFSGRLMIKFSKPGRYVFDRLYVSAMSTENFDKYAAERCASVYEVTDRKSDIVSGTLDAKSDGWLFLSMPVNTNWNVFIDGGQVAEIHNANIAFFATPVTKGSHTVELRYDHRNRNIAAAVSGAGLLLMTALGMLDRRRRKKEKEEEAGGEA